MAYLPIGDYGIIGDMRTCALVGKNGSIDWMCYPRFDSPSVFAKTLDDEIGGHFQIHPVHTLTNSKQFYWPETNVLVTRFVCEEGVGEVRDFMTLDRDDDDHQTRVVRQVVCVRDEMNFQLACHPAFDYARGSHEITLSENGAVFEGGDGLRLSLSSPVSLEQSDAGVVATFRLKQGETLTFCFQESQSECAPPHTDQEGQLQFEDTVRYWRQWLAQCTYTGRWRGEVHRSALALKLLTYKPTGAIVAAPTMGLPEQIGGERNWDYRYVWIRDAAFTLYGLMRVGFTEEAGAFMNWLYARTQEENGSEGPLQPLYTIDGETEIAEIELDHLKGYRESKPVRLGNAAHEQFQLDMYGALMDAVYLHNKHGQQVSYDFYTYLRPILDWVCDNWQRKDDGIWESRDEPQNHVYSRLMCWVALDRGLRLADKRSFPAPRERWIKNRDAIYEEVQAQGYDEQIQAFTQAYDNPSLDASALIMPLVFFMAPSDPRMINTIEAMRRHPENGGLTEDSLVYRYNPDDSPDGLRGTEGSFNMCTFWLVEAMTRAGRNDPAYMNEARLMFERMLGYANHLGLYAEETGDRGEALGNFPQAFTHLSLISAAFNLNRYLDS